jgi:hypothetical protein
MGFLSTLLHGHYVSQVAAAASSNGLLDSTAEELLQIEEAAGTASGPHSANYQKLLDHARSRRAAASSGTGDSDGYYDPDTGAWHPTPLWD